MEKNISTFGEFFRAKRKKLGLTLRKFCARNRLDPVDISKLEEGIKIPPKGLTSLTYYANILNIKIGSTDWKTLIYLARSYKKPKIDIITKLPTLICKSDGKKPTSKGFDKLVKLLEERYK